MYASSSMSSSSSSRSMSSGVGGMGLHGGSASSSTYVGGGGMMHGGGSISVGKELAIARKPNVDRSVVDKGNSMMIALSALSGGTASYCGAQSDGGLTTQALLQRRTREKTDFSAYNEKLANYMELNVTLRSKNAHLEAEIKRFSGKFETIDEKLRAHYEAELASLRQKLDATARDKAEIALKCSTLEEHYEMYKTRYESEYSSHEMTKLRIPQLEKDILEKEAKINFLSQTLSDLEPKVTLLKEEIKSYQKKSINAEILRNEEITNSEDLKMQLQTKYEEIEFVKKIYDEKLRFALDFDLDSDTTFSSDMAEAIKDIRAEYQAQLEALKAESGAERYAEEFDRLMKNNEKLTKNLQVAREETKSVKISASQGYQELKAYQFQITQLKELEARLRSDHAAELAALQAMYDAQKVEMNELQVTIASLRQEMITLLSDAKWSMNTELATYKRLLVFGEGSETGTGGGGSSGGGSVVTGGVVTGGVVTGGVVTGGVVTGGVVTGGDSGLHGGSTQLISKSASSVSLASASSSASSSTTVAQSTSKTTFSTMSKGKGGLTETAVDGKFITIENKTGSALSLAGWKIERCVDMGELIVYAFPSDTTLQAFGSLKIWASGVAGATNAAGNLIWAGGNTWGIGFNASNELKNAAGEVEASLTQKTSLM
jgi:hypothetical protein